MRSGNVAIIGRTNVGKSTFLNAALQMELAITSPLPQTTRDELLAVVHRKGAEMKFVDTPGLHRPKTELGRRMNAAALGSLKNNDVVVFVTSAERLSRRPKRSFLPNTDPIAPDDRRLLQALPETTPAVLVINKVDTLRDKARLLPLLTAFDEAHSFAAIIPVCMLNPTDVECILQEIEKLLPEGEARFDDETLTDRPLSFFAREYVREQVLRQARAEVPHAVAVSIDRFEQRPKLCLISATIHVEKSGQGSILVGHGGRTIKSIGIGARERLEELIGTRVHLELFVRVSDRWKDEPRRLSELGYDREGRSLLNLLPEQPDAPPRPKRAKPRTADEARASKKARKTKATSKPATKPAKESQRRRSTGGASAKPKQATTPRDAKKKATKHKKSGPTRGSPSGAPARASKRRKGR